MQSDAYQATGCYNLLCSGFVQTNNKIAIGAAISPTSSYGGGQFDISLLIWKVISLLYNEIDLGKLLTIYNISLQLLLSFFISFWWVSAVFTVEWKKLNFVTQVIQNGLRVRFFPSLD